MTKRKSHSAEFKTGGKATKAALEHGWRYIISEGGSRPNQTKYQQIK